MNLKKLTIARLKAYRKSLIPKVKKFEMCPCCGDMGCEERLKIAKETLPQYIQLKNTLNEVNKELENRQKQKI